MGLDFMTDGFRPKKPSSPTKTPDRAITRNGTRDCRQRQFSIASVTSRRCICSKSAANFGLKVAEPT
jgi:hypothetical protein